MLLLDTGALLCSLFVALVAVASYYIIREHIPAWEKRGFERLSGWWPTVFHVSGAVGTFVAFMAYVRTEGQGVGVQTYASLVLGIFAFFMTFMGWTDLYTMKAPTEMAHLGFALTAPLGVLALILGEHALPEYWLSFFMGNFALDHWVQTLIFMALMALAWRYVPDNQLGAADVRGLFIAGIGITPLSGLFPTIYFLGAASFVQVLLLLVLAPLFGWGRPVEDPMKKSRMAVNHLWTRITGSKKELLHAWTSRATPLLPAIGFAFLVGGLVFA